MALLLPSIFASLFPGHFRISRYVQVPIIIGFGVSMGQGPKTCSAPSRCCRGIWVLKTAYMGQANLKLQRNAFPQMDKCG